MKSSKKAVIWIGLAACISFLICIVLFANGWSTAGKGSIIYDFSLACFGSAVLGVIVAMTSYTTERQAAMESFYEEAVRAYNIIAVFPDMGIMMKRELELLCIYFKELEAGGNTEEIESELREWYSVHGQDLLKKDKDDQPSFKSAEERDTFVSEKMSRLPQLGEDIHKAAKILSKYRDYDLIGLHQSYGRLDFFNNLDLRSQCADHIYVPLNGVKEYCLKHLAIEYEREGKIGQCCYDVLFLNYVFYHRYYSKPPFIEPDWFKSMRKDLDEFFEKIELRTLSNWIDKKLGVRTKTASHPMNIGARDTETNVLRIDDIRME